MQNSIPLEAPLNTIYERAPDEANQHPMAWKQVKTQVLLYSSLTLSLKFFPRACLYVFQAVFHLTLHRSHSTAVLARLDWVETLESERHQPRKLSLSSSWKLLLKTAASVAHSDIALLKFACQQTQTSKTIWAVILKCLPCWGWWW